MKRWPIILCRGGTVLLAVGLALLLVSFIPYAQVNIQGPPQVIGSASWQTYYIDTITPQQTLDITITTNGTLDIYLLETWPETAYEWISEHNPGLTDFPNVTYFDQFLEANPTLIAWQSEIHDGTVDQEYIPTAVVNMTLAVSNHGSDSVSVDYQYSLRSGVAPTAKVRLLSEFAIPIGFVFTLPWLNELVRAKKKRDS
jgi:hypothetical protein